MVPPSSPCGTGHPSFSCGPPPLWNGTSFLLLLPWFSFFYKYSHNGICLPPPPPPVERDILPSFPPPPLWNGTSFLLLLPWSVVLLHTLSSLKPLYNYSYEFCLEPLRAQIIIQTIAYDGLRVILIIRVSTKNHTKSCLNPLTLLLIILRSNIIIVNIVYNPLN